MRVGGIRVIELYGWFFGEMRGEFKFRREVILVLRWEVEKGWSREG